MFEVDMNLLKIYFIFVSLCKEHMNYETQQNIDNKLANTVVELRDPLIHPSADAYTAVNTHENVTDTMSGQHAFAGAASSAYKMNSPLPRSTASNQSSTNSYKHGSRHQRLRESYNNAYGVGPFYNTNLSLIQAKQIIMDGQPAARYQSGKKLRKANKMS